MSEKMRKLTWNQFWLIYFGRVTHFLVDDCEKRKECAYNFLGNWNKGFFQITVDKSLFFLKRKRKKRVAKTFSSCIHRRCYNFIKKRFQLVASLKLYEKTVWYQWACVISEQVTRSCWYILQFTSKRIYKNYFFKNLKVWTFSSGLLIRWK